MLVKRASAAYPAILENFEPRQLLAAVAWDGGAGDNLWHSAANWSTNVVPTAADDVTISVPGSPLVTFNSSAGSQSIRSLVSDEELSFTGGTLALTTTANINASMTVDGGTLVGGTWEMSGAPSGAILIGRDGGTLTDVIVSGDLALALYVSRVNIVGGTRFRTAHLSGEGSHIYFASGYVLRDAVVAEGNGAARGFGLIGGSGQLTIAKSGSVRIAPDCYSDLTLAGNINLFNDGLFSSESWLHRILFYNLRSVENSGIFRAVAGTIRVGGSAFHNTGLIELERGAVELASIQWINKGTIVGASDSTLSFSGSWTNTGTISLADSVLNLGGTFTYAAMHLAGISRVGGSVNLTGTLNNTSSTLTLNNLTGSWTLKGGTISGGGVNFADGRRLETSSSGGTLKNVLLDGDMTLVVPNAKLNIQGTTRFHTIYLLYTNCRLAFLSGYTLLDTVVADGPSNQVRVFTAIAPFSLGATGAIRMAPDFNGILFIESDGEIVNNGLIANEAIAGRWMIFDKGSLRNNGTLRATAGTVSIPAASVSNYDAFSESLSGGIWQFENATFDMDGGEIRVIAPGTRVAIGGTSGGIPAMDLLRSNNGILTIEHGRSLTLSPVGLAFLNAGEIFVDETSRLNVTGAYSQTAAGRLSLAVAGPGSYARLVASNIVFLDGALAVDYTGYALSRGDSFELISAASITGTFASSSIGGVQNYDRPFLRYEPTRVRLEILAAADWDGDGFITGLDYDLFVDLFEQGKHADLDGDGMITSLDFDLFVYAFEHG